MKPASDQAVMHAHALLIHKSLRLPDGVAGPAYMTQLRVVNEDRRALSVLRVYSAEPLVIETSMMQLRNRAMEVGNDEDSTDLVDVFSPSRRRLSAEVQDRDGTVDNEGGE